MSSSKEAKQLQAADVTAGVGILWKGFLETQVPIQLYSSATRSAALSDGPGERCTFQATMKPGGDARSGVHPHQPYRALAPFSPGSPLLSDYDNCLTGPRFRQPFCISAQAILAGRHFAHGTHV